MNDAAWRECLKILAEHANTADQNAVWPATSWQALARAGVLGWSIDQAHGGSGRDAVALLSGHEQLASVCLTTCFILSQRDAAVRRIAGAGHAELCDELLPPLATSRRHNVTGIYFYPDIVAICGEPEYQDANKDIILNPKVVMEVLSPSTEAFDRGEKFTRNQTPTLTDYVLVSQDQPQIEHFQRQSDGSWSYHRNAGPESDVAIPSIQCVLKLADVYDRVLANGSSDAGSA